MGMQGSVLRTRIWAAQGTAWAGCQEVVLEELGVIMVSCRCVDMAIAGHSKAELCYCRASKTVKRGTDQQRGRHFLSMCLEDGEKQWLTYHQSSAISSLRA